MGVLELIYRHPLELEVIHTTYCVDGPFAVESRVMRVARTLQRSFGIEIRLETAKTI